MIIKCWDAMCTSIAYIISSRDSCIVAQQYDGIHAWSNCLRHASTSACYKHTAHSCTECSNTVCWIKSVVSDRDVCVHAFHPFPLTSMEPITRNDHMNCTVRIYAIHMRISCDLRCFRWCAGRAYCIFAYAMALASVWLFSHSVNICTRWNCAPQI